ncbi:MAG: TlpA family protein disulfide reductase [Planctomycetia bacterium]|nr:TlpA family protein disulfide reductase [Planctomycetia bacterium]
MIARLPCRTITLAAVCCCLTAGCGGPAGPHPAVGRTMDRLPLVSLADPSRPAPRYAGRVTLLNLWGTWCMPCRRELPGLVRLAARLEAEPAFQLVAVSCGPGGTDETADIAATTTRFLGEERLSLDAWADPDGMARVILAGAFGFDAFPTSYLVGPDARVRRVWVGYRPRDEADMARAIVEMLREIPAPAGTATPAAPAAR